MGLPSLTLSGDLCNEWQRLLEDNGIGVSLDEDEIARVESIRQDHGVSENVNVAQAPYRVVHDKATVSLLEVRYLNRSDPNTYLVFEATLAKSKADRELLSQIERLLIDAGATRRKKRRG